MILVKHIGKQKITWSIQEFNYYKTKQVLAFELLRNRKVRKVVIVGKKIFYYLN